VRVLVVEDGIAQGFAELGLSDDERLRVGFPIYDALYAYVRYWKSMPSRRSIVRR